VAPLRHELALADYVEKQAKLRNSGVPATGSIVGIGDAVIGACVAGCRALAALASGRPGRRIA